MRGVEIQGTFFFIVPACLLVAAQYVGLHYNTNVDGRINFLALLVYRAIALLFPYPLSLRLN